MFSNLSLMFKLNVVAIIFGEIWQLRECSSGAILLVFVDNRANFPTHTMHRSAVVDLRNQLNASSRSLFSNIQEAQQVRMCTLSNSLPISTLLIAISSILNLD